MNIATIGIWLGALLLAAHPGFGTTSENKLLSPTEFLMAHEARAQEILAQVPGDTLSSKERETMKSHIFAAFDFDELSRLSLGVHWDQRTPDERAEFVRLTTGVIEEQNLDDFVSYYRRGDTVYKREAIDGEKANVAVMVPLEKQDQIEIEYRLHRVNGMWRVYDLVIDGVSTAEGNRRRYGRYLKKKTYEQLLERLQKQLERLTGRAE